MPDCSEMGRKMYHFGPSSGQIPLKSTQFHFILRYFHISASHKSFGRVIGHYGSYIRTEFQWGIQRMIMILSNWSKITLLPGGPDFVILYVYNVKTTSKV